MKFLFVFFIFLAMQVVCVGQHEYVDLGLPSGTLWATCNVGANNPEDIGDYFAWGEINTKSDFSIATYKYCKDDHLTKYCSVSDYGYNGYIDNLKQLQYSDDVAYQKWGSDWCMPTMSQFIELLQCTWTETVDNRKVGYEVIGPNGKSIFLPESGFRSDKESINLSFCGYYWTSNIQSCNGAIEGILLNFLCDCRDAYYCSFNAVKYEMLSISRIFGLSVRPVRRNKRGQENPQTSTIPSGIVDGHAYVDLGLPSGTKWATCNIGANNPWESGDYFAWGEINSKSYYDWSTYKYANRKFTKLTKYCNIRSYGNKRYTDSHINLERSDDVASQKWGNEWCIPTGTQFKELKEKCIWTWTIRNGKNGYEVKGPNGKSIFLPITGLKGSGALEDAKYSGQYWLSSLNTDLPFCALGFGFQSDNNVYMKDYFIRYYGMSVRPVLRQ